MTTEQQQHTPLSEYRIGQLRETALELAVRWMIENTGAMASIADVIATAALFEHFLKGEW